MNAKSVQTLVEELPVGVLRLNIAGRTIGLFKTNS
jgi:hypothetical protein